MAEFQIKGESQPERCEICHQSDCFDPKTNHCSRCGESGINASSVPQGARSTRLPKFLNELMRPPDADPPSILPLAVIGVFATIVLSGASLWLFGNYFSPEPKPKYRLSAPSLPPTPRPSPVQLPPAAFTFFSNSDRFKSLDGLKEMLSTYGRSTAFYQAPTLEETADSQADVLILMMERIENPQFSADLLNGLKSRKVIGIGYGAAQLFEKMGLEIVSEEISHNPDDYSPEIDVTTSGTTGSKGIDYTITAFNLPGDAGYLGENFAINIPRESPLRFALDVVARWSDKKNYAPIVRQGNHILIGLTAPVETWTPPYRNFFREMTTALLNRNPEPFSKAILETTAPGLYELQLAESGSTDEISTWTYYFQFNRPTRFSVKLEQQGSYEVGLILIDAERRRVAKATGKDQPIELSAYIKEEDVKNEGSRYWRLKVFNGDQKNKAACRLRIEYKSDQGAAAEQLLPAPLQISPLEGEVFNHYPRNTLLTWAEVPGAATYRVQIDCYHCCLRDAWCTDVKESLGTMTVYTTEYSFDFYGAQPGRWRVWAVDENGKEGVKSEWRTFKYLK